ncbi:MAG: rhodanese-like domain-containing protein [Planctomycetota bacterium]
MFVRMLYDESLAQASYLIGCPGSGEAIVIDPERDVDRYIELAAREKLRITHAAETHVHADFLSGVRELAHRVGAIPCVSDEGGDDWTPRWLKDAPVSPRLLRHNDIIQLGGVRIRAIHTPGHTPEHLCFELTDTAQQPSDNHATEPMGLLTGDFVFVGDLGRPDLLETAVGQTGAMEPAARELHRSAAAFLELPDFLQVWPGHGAGSACGKNLGSVPQSTVGYERRYNAALRAVPDADAFVAELLAGQPEPPPYFARMKQLNLEGPPVLGAVPTPPRLTLSETLQHQGQAAVLLDTRLWNDFRQSHLKGALNTPLDRHYSTVAASYIDADSPIVLIAQDADIAPAVQGLIRVGLDRIVGVLDPAELDHTNAGVETQSIPEIDAPEAARRAAAGEALLLDVRRAAEHAQGHPAGSANITHVHLRQRLAELSDTNETVTHRPVTDRPIIVSCLTGARSARAAALLQREGFDVTNMQGGYEAWNAAELPIERSTLQCRTTGQAAR